MGLRLGLLSTDCFRPASPNTAQPFIPSLNELPQRWDDSRIVALRPPKKVVDPARPYAFLVELERTMEGTVEDTAVLFLTNRECPFQCLMCDLWKNTTDVRTADGAIPGQIE